MSGRRASTEKRRRRWRLIFTLLQVLMTIGSVLALWWIATREP